MMHFDAMRSSAARAQGTGILQTLRRRSAATKKLLSMLKSTTYHRHPNRPD